MLIKQSKNDVNSIGYANSKLSSIPIQFNNDGKIKGKNCSQSLPIS